ncbi:MAG: FAD-dependent oxidoreductase [Candidatus Dadabacteria bacterium]|nr:MAG: FAD-dependent oxidoreductase [Candidatus Dadabacteria bacterium]
MPAKVEVVDARSVTHFDAVADVLVVGLGCAGAAAAIEAASCGAQVLAIERASGGGGTSALSGGVIYLGGGTRLQKACGFEDSPEEMYKYLMAACGPRPDETRIRIYCEQSVEHFEWFVAQGVPFKPVFYPHYSGEPPTDDGLVFSGNEEAYPFSSLAKPAPRGHVPQIPGQAGGLLMKKLLASVERHGVEVRTDTRADALVVGGDGRVIGVRVRSFGERAFLRARGGVILTTGGFINNQEMVATFAPLLAQCKFRVGAEGDDGSGIRMGMAVGAAAINMHMGSVSLPIIPPKKLQKGILVDRHGQRFINEDAYYGRLGEYALYRHDGHAYLFLDNETFERPAVEREIAAVGETVEEVERELGLPPGSLQRTVALYNEHAARGQDPQFGKAPEWLVPLVHPPFAALDCTTSGSLYAAFTLGGLRTGPNGEVLTADGEAVPGLFAAGRTAASLAAPGYASGISIGDGTFFGRRAGRAAALATRALT